MSSSSTSPDVAATANAIAAKYTSKSDQLKLHELPRDVINKILFELAHLSYNDIPRLGDIYHEMEGFCNDFIESNPKSNFVDIRPAGQSDSEEDEENNDYDDDDWSYGKPDDLDAIEDMLERFSYGSDYDEDVDEYINGPDHANYDEAYGGEEESSNVGGDQPPTYEVTEGW